MSPSPNRTFSLDAIVKKVKGDLIQEADVLISGVNSLENAGSQDAAFYRDKKFYSQLCQTKAGLVFVPTDFQLDAAVSHPALIRVANPVLAFAKLTQAFMDQDKHPSGISPLAFVHPEAQIDPSASVYPFAYIGEKTIVGAHTVLFPHSYLGRNVTVGSHCLIHSQASVMDGTEVGDRVILNPGAVVGSDGFGYTPDESTGRAFKVPQLGRVRLEDDVEIGANSTIDRATMDWTILKRGSKLDNLVQVGHNCIIGENAIICSQVGISGSTTIGNNVVMAGQVGTYSHVKIGNNVTVTARGGISKDIPDGQTVKGYPAVPIQEYLTLQAMIQKLPDMREKLLQLEKEVKEMKNTSLQTTKPSVEISH